MTGKKQFATIDEYIGSFPADLQVTLEKIRQTIHNAVPEATEAISYNIPTFDLNGSHLIFFAGWKHSISVYPLPAGDAAFQAKIAPYRREKSTLHLPVDQPVPYDLVGQIARFLKAGKLANPGSAE